jgi:hypothetical protein
MLALIAGLAPICCDKVWAACDEWLGKHEKRMTAIEQANNDRVTKLERELAAAKNELATVKGELHSARDVAEQFRTWSRPSWINQYAISGMCRPDDDSQPPPSRH